MTADQFNFLLKNEVKIYPVSTYLTKKWKIQVSVHGKIKTFPKEISASEIQEAMDKTQLFYYDKLKTENKND